MHRNQHKISEATGEDSHIQRKVLQHNPEREECDGGDKGPYDHTKYTQCDYVLTKKEQFHSVIVCEVQMSKATNSDLYPLVDTIKTNMKLAKTSKEK